MTDVYITLPSLTLNLRNVSGVDISIQYQVSVPVSVSVLIDCLTLPLAVGGDVRIRVGNPFLAPALLHPTDISNNLGKLPHPSQTHTLFLCLTAYLYD